MPPHDEADRLGQALDQALETAVEPVVEPPLPPPEGASDDPRRLWVRLTAATAFRADLAHRFCRALAKRLDLEGAVLERVEMATHEALSNALVHGALEIDTRRRESIATYDAYCQLVEDRLKDPAYGARSIDLIARWNGECLEVEVRDSGPGYARAAAVGATEGDGEAARKSGRGLDLIRDLSDSLRVTDDGRRLTMRFRR